VSCTGRCVQHDPRLEPLERTPPGFAFDRHGFGPRREYQSVDLTNIIPRKCNVVTKCGEIVFSRLRSAGLPCVRGGGVARRRESGPGLASASRRTSSKWFGRQNALTLRCHGRVGLLACKQWWGGNHGQQVGRATANK
jgi:hypothetical protein